MKDNKHISQTTMIEYFYKEAINHYEIENHLKTCVKCKQEYDQLTKDMEIISSPFKHDLWKKQRQEIMETVNKPSYKKQTLWFQWLKPAFIVAILLIIVLSLYFKSNHRVRYPEQDILGDIFLVQIAELTEQSLTTSLEYLDFQEEDQPEVQFAQYSDKLNVLDYWPEIEI